MNRMAERYGPLYTFRLPGRQWVVVSDLGMIRDVMVAQRRSVAKGATMGEIRAMGIGYDGVNEADGDDWTHKRRVVQPAFAADATARGASIVGEALDRVEALLDRAGSGVVVDVLDLMNRFTLSVVCEFAFGFRSKALDSLTAAEPVMEREAFLTEEAVKRYQRTPAWKHLPLPSNFAVKRAVKAQVAFLESLIAARRARGPVAGAEPDVLDLLLADRGPCGHGVSTAEVVMQMHSFLGPGTEAAAAALHWLLYMVSGDDELGAEVARESAAIPEPGSLLEAIVAETFRVRTPVPLLFREAVADLRVGRWTVPKGAFVVCLLQRAHVDEQLWWSNATEFAPRRMREFLARDPARVKAQLHPFGIGPRRCVGEALGHLEVSMAAARLLRRFRFTAVGPRPPVPYLKVARVAKGGLRMRVERR
jgi:cytochrome P450